MNVSKKLKCGFYENLLRSHVKVSSFQNHHTRQKMKRSFHIVAADDVQDIEQERKMMKRTLREFQVFPGDWYSDREQDADMVLITSFYLGPQEAFTLACNHGLVTETSRFTHEGWLFPEWLAERVINVLRGAGFHCDLANEYLPDSVKRLLQPSISMVIPVFEGTNIERFCGAMSLELKSIISTGNSLMELCSPKIVDVHIRPKTLATTESIIEFLEMQCAQ